MCLSFTHRNVLTEYQLGFTKSRRIREAILTLRLILERIYLGFIGLEK